MKQLKKQLLFCLSDGVRFFGQTKAAVYTSYSQLYWRLKVYRQVSIRGAANGLLKKEMIAKINQKDGVKFRLASTGRDYLREEYSRVVGAERKWDRLWRVLICIGLGAKKSRQLAAEITKFGFVKLTRGVYISVENNDSLLKRELSEKRLIDGVKILSGKKFILGDDRQLAVKLWGLNKVYQSYKNVISLGDRVLYRVQREKGLTNQLKSDYRRLLFNWFKAIKTDPGLPKSLWTGDWPRQEAIKMVAKVAAGVRRLEEEE